jgi:hypothetical protein
MATIKGIWVFNDYLTWEDFGSHNVNFTSNSKTFTSISCGTDPDYMDSAALAYANDGETVYVYNFEYTNEWSNEAYKTVDFGSTEQTVDDTFYTWLTANATQQSQTTPVTRKFTKLNIGDIVASSGGRVWKKLSTESGSTDGNYLTFSSPNSFTLNVVDNTKYWDGTLEYSTDTSTWNTWDGTTALSADNGKLYMRGIGNTRITGTSTTATVWRWVLTGSEISCNGNIENLLDYQTVANGAHPIMAKHCYRNMFRDCTGLTTAPELPATTLTDYCYRSMFYGCTGLATPPELPATTLAQYCYSYMFSGCTNLTTAPELPATTLAVDCYEYMFKNCTSLATAPALPATTLADYCYYNMFRDCTSLTTAPELPATTLADRCYWSMFQNCSSLVKAPSIIPADEIFSMGCTEMFKNCTSLTTAPELPATKLSYQAYYSMFSGCTSLTTAPALPATTLNGDCYNSMFNGCTSLTTAPALPATTLNSDCYNYMFKGCTNIKLSTTQTDEYQNPYRIPTSGTGTKPLYNDVAKGMFESTGGTFTGTPSINTTYYTSNTVV